MSDQNNPPETAEDYQPTLDKVKSFVKRYDIELAVAAYGLFTLRLASKLAKVSRTPSAATMVGSVLDPAVFHLAASDADLKKLLSEPGSQMMWDLPGMKFLLDVVE